MHWTWWTCLFSSLEKCKILSRRTQFFFFYFKHFSFVFRPYMIHIHPRRCRFSRVLIFRLIHELLDFWMSSWDAFPKSSILVPDLLFLCYLILCDPFAYRMWNWHQNVRNLIGHFNECFDVSTGSSCQHEDSLNSLSI